MSSNIRDRQKMISYLPNYACSPFEALMGSMRHNYRNTFPELQRMEAIMFAGYGDWVTIGDVDIMRGSVFAISEAGDGWAVLWTPGGEIKARGATRAEARKLLHALTPEEREAERAREEAEHTAKRKAAEAERTAKIEAFRAEVLKTIVTDGKQLTEREMRGLFDRHFPDVYASRVSLSEVMPPEIQWTQVFEADDRRAGRWVPTGQVRGMEAAYAQREAEIAEKERAKRIAQRDATRAAFETVKSPLIVMLGKSEDGRTLSQLARHLLAAHEVDIRADELALLLDADTCFAQIRRARWALTDVGRAAYAMLGAQ